MRPSAYTRFLRGYVVTDAGCWEWQRSKDHKGYGQLFVHGKVCRAPRFSYETFVGPIPEGLQIDHLCRNPSCVNPEHMEPVTNAENQRRRPRKSHCPKGHPYNDENTRHYNGRRHCRTCQEAVNSARSEQRSRERFAARLAEGRAPDPRMLALREAA